MTNAASAAEITVGDSQEYTNITTAIANATDGDTIIVTDGTYTENIVVNKSVTIRSESGPDSTIVQAKSVNAHIFNVTASNVTISGFNVTGATNNSAAIYMHSASSCNISNNLVSGSYAGIYSYNSNDSLIKDNQIGSNTIGLYLRKSTNNTLIDNTMESNTYNFGAYGPNQEHFTHNINTSNQVNGKPLYYLVNQADTQIPLDAGQVYVVSSTNITVKDISISNGYDGVLLAYTNNSRVENVTVSQNDYGVALINSDFNTLDKINANNNTCGIDLENSTDNILTDSTIASGGWDGISLYFSSDRNTINNNTIISGGCDGIYIDNSDDNILSSNTITGNPESGIDLYQSANNDIINNIITNNTYHGIYLNESSYNTLTNNNASENSQNGIYLYNSSDYNTLTDNIASENDHGIYLSSSNNNTLRENTATNNTLQGIYLNVSTYNTLTDNNASENLWDGIYLYNSSDYNTLTGNTANHNPNSVEIGSISIDNTVSPNDLTTGNGNGIYLEDSNDNTLDSNTANYNQYNGIYLCGLSDHNTLNDNNAIENYRGIYLSGSNNNILTENNASENNYGIRLSYSNNNTLTGNIANSNQNSADVKALSLDNEVISTGIFFVEPSGISLLESDNNTLTDNAANYNSHAGIYVESSADNNLVSNTASYSTGNYMMDLSVELNAVINRDAISTSSYGIVFSGSANSTSTGDRSIGNDYEFRSISSNNIAVDKLILNDKSAQVSFVTDERLIQLNGTETNPYSLSGKANVNGYITMSTESIAPDIALSFPDNIITKFSYSDSGMSSSGESSIALYKLNNSSWVKVPNATLNTNGDYVSANLTEFGTFGLFKDPEPESSGDGSSLMARIRSEGTITDIPVGNDGEITGDTVVKSSDSTSTLTLYKGTKAVDLNGDPVSKIIVTTPASLPADTPREVVESGLYFDFGPDGTTFSQDVMITLDFNPEEFEGRAPVIYAYTSEEGWVALETTVDWENGRATAMINHFSLYALFGTDAEDVQDTSVELASEDVSSPTAVEEDTPTEDDDNSGYVAGIIGILIILGAVIIVVKNQKDKEGL
ncbi:MAG: putative cell surface protein [Methanolobus sp. T82-4]|nr:MAG: putative cell surface protein [Methanolobus sp. T82-4]